MNPEQAAREEVLDLHRFLSGWLDGSLPKTRQAFARFSGALAGDFTIVFTSGNLIGRQAMIAELWDSHGMKSPPYPIEIKTLATRPLGAEYCLATYREYQPMGHAMPRVCSALFRLSSSGDAVEWVHLHETWLKSKEHP